MSEQNICDTCRKNIFSDCERKTCDECRERARCNRLRTTRNPEYVKTNEGLKKCTSRTQCDSNNSGIKVTLPKDYPYIKCEFCMM